MGEFGLRLEGYDGVQTYTIHDFTTSLPMSWFAVAPRGRD